MSELYKAERMRGGDTVNSMTISKGTCKRKRNCIFMEISEGEWVEIDPTTLVQVSGKAVDRVRELEACLEHIKTISMNDFDHDMFRIYNLCNEKLTPKSEV